MAPQILVIDDDPVVRSVLKRVLEKERYEVALAPDGRAGIELMREIAPKLVITDIIMPEKEGLETIIEMRRLNPALRIIAISGGGRMGNVDLLKLAAQLGADDVVSKPFEPVELVEKVKRQLAQAN